MLGTKIWSDSSERRPALWAVAEALDTGSPMATATERLVALIDAEDRYDTSPADLLREQIAGADAHE